MRYVHVDHLKGTGCNLFWGSVAGIREISHAEELVESYSLSHFQVSGLVHQGPRTVLLQEIERNSYSARNELRPSQGYHCQLHQYQGTLVEKGRPQADLFVTFK